MKWAKDREGRNRLWLDPDEIETIMEDELSKAGLYPALDNPVVDVERLIERHLSANLDRTAPLDPSILGVTEFEPGKPPTILINADLTGLALDQADPHMGTIGRWRATLAHEAAHVILHRMLFELDQGQLQLFKKPVPGKTGNDRLLRCQKKELSFEAARVGRDWREVQANMGMAALLMPRRLYGDAARQEFKKLGKLVGLQGDPSAVGLVTQRMSDRFNVSRQAAGIRLKTLNLLCQGGQAGLPG